MSSVLCRFWNNKEARFVAIGLVLYLLWDLVLFRRIMQIDAVNRDFTQLNRLHTQAVLQLVSDRYYLVQETLQKGAMPLFRIIPSCNAVNFMAHFLCFVLAFPAHWISKTVFIPLGLLAIYLLNIARLIGLAFTAEVVPDLFGIIHSWVWPAIIYTVVIAMCLGWISITEKQNRL